MMVYDEEQQTTEYYALSITWSCDVTWQIKTLYFDFNEAYV